MVDASTAYIVQKMTRIRREKGLKVLIQKVFLTVATIVYIAYLSLTLKRRCHGLTLEGSVDFMFNGIRGLIRPFQKRSEILSLARLVAERKPATVVEIGTASGGTLFLFSKLADDRATIVSIDLPLGRYGGGYFVWRIPLYRSFVRLGQRLYLLRADSHRDATLEKCRLRLKGTPIDFLFIDGDHSYEGVKKDFQMYKALVRKGGMVAFHDIVMHPPAEGCAVHTFWNEIKPAYRYTEFIESPDQIGCGIGVIFID